MTRKQINRVIWYLVFNGIFVTSIYYGFFENVEGAKNVALFMGWGLGQLE